jgi:hypothetical protein
MAIRSRALDRRSFLSTLSAVGGWLTVQRRPRPTDFAPRVEAESTAFYAHPDGALNLVRFSIEGVDAPAGRLRVYDGERRLLGTAGVIRRNETLYGELWLPLERAKRILSELEAPGVRGPYRTGHQLTPHRRWVIHLLSAVDPERVAEELVDLPSFHRAARTALYRMHGVRIDMVPPRNAWDKTDHISFLETAAQRTAQARNLGVLPGMVGTTDDVRGLSSAHVLALTSVGVRAVVVSDQGEPFQWLEGPDASRLLVVSLPSRSTPTDLGFLQGLDAMTTEVEQWLSTSPDSLFPTSDQGTAVISSGDLGAATDAIDRSVSEWNQRFAFPTIISGDVAALWQSVAHRRGAAIPVITPAPAVSVDLPTRVEIDAMTAARQRRDALRSSSIFRLLAEVVRSKTEDLAGVASRVSALIPGTVVFNPSPFSRSEFVHLLDGTERVVTDIPGLGYAYFPDRSTGGRSGWEELSTGREIEGPHFRARLNPATGAVESLVSLTDGIEWARPGSPGLNAVDSSRLVRVSVNRLPDTATRLILERWSQGRGALRTTLTLYDRLPWLDIHNEAEVAGDRPVSYGFHFAVREPHISWEVPGGVEESDPPVPHLDHLRWLRVAGRRDAILLAGIDAPPASVGSDGAVFSYASRGTARYRVGLHSEYDSPDLPWQFGWGTTPMLTAPATPGNAGDLPTFGAILDVERVGVVVPGIVRSRISDGVVVYLQELQGIRREVSVSAGLVRFKWAQQVDFLEREIGGPLEPRNGAVVVPLSGRGVASVRLHGLELNRE